MLKGAIIKHQQWIRLSSAIMSINIISLLIRANNGDSDEQMEFIEQKLQTGSL